MKQTMTSQVLEFLKLKKDFTEPLIYEFLLDSATFDAQCSNLFLSTLNFSHSPLSKSLEEKSPKELRFNFLYMKRFIYFESQMYTPIYKGLDMEQVNKICKWFSTQNFDKKEDEFSLR